MLRGNKSDKKLEGSIYDTKPLWALLCVFPKNFCLALRRHQQLADLPQMQMPRLILRLLQAAWLRWSCFYHLCCVYLNITGPTAKKKKTQLTPKTASTSEKIRTLYRSCAAVDSSHLKCDLPDPICPNWHYSEAMVGELWMTFFYWALLHFQSSREQTSSLLQERAFLSKAWHTPQGRRSVKQNLFRW